MPYLNAEILRDLVDLLAPLMQRRDERSALLFLAIGEDTDQKRNLLHRIDYGEATEPFVLNMSRQLANFGEISPGKQAIISLLEVASRRLGVDKGNDVQTLIDQIQTISTTTETRTNVDALTWNDLLTDYVFISYSRSDRDFVSKLIDDLQDRGLKVWIDKQGLKPGTRNWEQALRDAIEHSRAILLIASPNSRKSNYVQDELAIAEMYKCPVYPVWANGEHWMDCVPIGMGRIQHIDARSTAYGDAINEIVATLRGIKPILPLSSPTVEEENQITLEQEFPRNFTPENPYKGLEAFTTQDADRFFGRETMVDQMLETLRVKIRPSESHFLAIMGASGSGKSSVVMAGVLPRLQKGALPGSENWVYINRILPGKNPLQSLADALYTIFPDRSMSSIDDDLRNPNARGLHRIACQLPRSDARLVLYVDQFEELFTQTLDEHERQQFIDLLTFAAMEADSPILVLLTMRADFYDRPLEYPILAELVKNPHPVLPMTLSDLYEVVQKPADLPSSKLIFDNDLVANLVFDVRDQPGALPLLQFTLNQLFTMRDGHRLTMRAYRKLGGVRGALANHAETTFNILRSKEHQELARFLFLRLIEPGNTEQDTTRHRAAMTELKLEDEEKTKIIRETAETFVDARLLVTNTTNNQETIEISHEALIREWYRLADWVNEARDDIRFQRSLRQNIDEWYRRGKPRGSDVLYRGTELSKLKDWAKRNLPSEVENEFIKASNSKVRRLTSTLIGCYIFLIGILLVVAALIGFTVYVPFLVSGTATSIAPAIDSQIRYIEANIMRDTSLVMTPLNGTLEPPDTAGLFYPTYANISLKNFVVEVTFQNPQDDQNGKWDYAILFRDSRSADDNGYRLIVDSLKNWQLSLGRTTIISRGTIQQLNINENGENHLRLVVRDDFGLFYVNSVFISILNLSDRTQAGDVGIGAGTLLENASTSAKITGFQNFTVWSLSSELEIVETPSPKIARLGENSGRLSIGSADIWTYNGLKGEIVTFRLEANWDTTLTIRNPDGSQLGFNDDSSSTISSSIQSLKLPEAGNYTIEVRSYGNNAGGTYNMIVENPS